MSDMKIIVIKVHLETKKCISKAFQIAAETPGVQSFSLLEDNSDQMVVTGDGVDAVCLTNRLRRKFRHATLISVNNLEQAGDGGGEEEEEEEEEETKPEENPSLPHDVTYQYHPCSMCTTTYIPALCPISATATATYHQPSASMCSHAVVYDSYPNVNSCTFL